MRTEFRKIAVISAVAATLIAAAMVIPWPRLESRAADYQGYPTTSLVATGLPTIITTSALSNSLNSWIPVYPGKGMGVTFNFTVSGGTAATGVLLSPSVDGTNISQTTITLWGVATGTTATSITTNWTRGQLDGFQFMVLTGLTNGNSGTLTNKGVVFNVPNS